MALLAIVMEWLLRKTPWGWRLRAVGSEEEAARRVGVPTNQTIIVGYMLTSLFTLLGGHHVDGPVRDWGPVSRH